MDDNHDKLMDKILRMKTFSLLSKYYIIILLMKIKLVKKLNKSLLLHWFKNSIKTLKKQIIAKTYKFIN